MIDPAADAAVLYWFQCSVFGVSTVPGETISAPQVPLGPAVIIFGDSWTGPTILPPAIGPAQPGLTGGGFPEALGEYFNWNYWADGVGGSGFTATGEDQLRRTWVQRLMTDVCGNNPVLQRLMMVGTVNDGNAAEPALQQAIEDGLAEVQSCLPEAPIYFSGAQLHDAGIEAADAAASAAEPANLTYFDLGAQNVLYGNNTDSSTGNAYLYLNDYPTPLGHDFLAEVLAADLSAKLPLLQPTPYTLFAPQAVAGTFRYSAATGALLPAGTQSIEATFTPADTTNFAVATAVQSITVRKATTSMILTASQTGSTVKIAVQVVPQIAGTPSGSVQISANGSALGTVSLTGGTGFLMLPTTSFSASPLQLTADYGGDSNFIGSSAVAAVSIFAPADFSFTVTSPTFVLQAGSSTSLPVAFTPINGFTGSVTAACTGLPSGAGCSLAGSPVQISNGPQTLTLMVTVPAALAQHNSIVPWPLRRVKQGFGPALGAAIFILMRRPRHAAFLLLCVAAVLGGSTLFGCSSGNSTANIAASSPTTVSQPVTPYTMQVTVAATPTLSHTQSVRVSIN